MSAVDQNIPPVPNQTPVEETAEKPQRFGPTWTHWFEQVRSKVNTINASLIGWSKVPINSGVTPGTYGDSTHYSTFSVNEHGLVTNATEEAFTGGSDPIHVVAKTTSYTPISTDAPAASSYKGLINIASGTPNTLTIPDNTSVGFPIGTLLYLYQGGSGSTTFLNGNGVTIQGPVITGGGQYALGKAIKINTNTWLVSGNLAFANVSAYNSAVISDGAIAYWPLQETSGTSAVDLISGLNGTYAGGYTLNQVGPAGVGGKSVLFNGSTGKITTATSTIISGSAFSVEIWAKISAYAGNIVFDHNGASTFEIQVGGTNQIIFNFSGAPKLLSTTGQPTGTLLHIVFTSDASGTKVYINGSLNNSNATAWHGGTSSGIFSFACRSGSSSFLNCQLAAASVYNNVLTATQIANHYTLGS